MTKPDYRSRTGRHLEVPYSRQIPWLPLEGFKGRNLTAIDADSQYSAGQDRHVIDPNGTESAICRFTAAFYTITSLAAEKIIKHHPGSISAEDFFPLSQ